MKPECRPNRVAVVTTVHPWGDPRIFEREVATMLEWGLEVDVFVSGPHLPHRDGWSDNPRLHIHLLTQTRTRGMRMKAALGLWKRVLKEGPFGVVHFHDPELIPAMAILALLARNCYVIYDIHEELTLEVHAKGYIPLPLRWPIVMLARALWWVASISCSGFAPATDPIARYWPPERTRCVRNYPKDTFSVATPEAGGPDPKRVTFNGGLAEVRGAREMFTAMELVRRERPEVQLEIAGGVIDPGLAPLLDKAVAEGWCTYHPWLTPLQLRAFSNGAGVGLCPYLPYRNYLEAMPTKVLEYMAMGIPVLASDFPLWKDLVEGTGSGRVCKPTAEALAKTLLDMLNDAKALQAYSLAGRAAYQSSYRWEVEQENLRWHYVQAGLLPPSTAVATKAMRVDNVDTGTSIPPN